MTYDAQCFDLAMRFVHDEFPALPDNVKHRLGDSLAQQIQYTIEEEIEQWHRDFKDK